MQLLLEAESDHFSAENDVFDLKETMDLKFEKKLSLAVWRFRYYLKLVINFNDLVLNSYMRIVK